MVDPLESLTSSHAFFKGVKELCHSSAVLLRAEHNSPSLSLSRWFQLRNGPGELTPDRPQTLTPRLQSSG